MSSVIYVDTSSLAKWYINESGSEEVEAYIRQNAPVAVSDLTVVEMRSLLARRRREESITPQIEMEVFATFEEDIRARFLVCHALPDAWSSGAVRLIGLLSDLPVRTLDVLHLLIAKEIDAQVLVTSDRIMARGAEGLGLRVVRF